MEDWGKRSYDNRLDTYNKERFNRNSEVYFKHINVVYNCFPAIISVVITEISKNLKLNLHTFTTLNIDKKQFK